MSEEPSVPDWRLERYLLGELGPAEAEDVRARLELDAATRERIESLRRSNEEILARHPPCDVAPGIRARLERDAPPERSPARPSWPRLALLATSSVVAVAVGLTAVTALRPGRQGVEPTRVKGLSPHLLLYRQGAAVQAEPLAPGTLARHHDVVQIAYQAAGRRYGVIVSIDGRGVVTRHLPEAGSQAAALKPGAAVPLPTAYELDDAPEYERFLLAVSDDPFAVEMVIDALRRRPGATGRLDLPPSVDQFSFVLGKAATR